MNKLYLKCFLLLAFLSFFVMSNSSAQLFHKNPEKSLFGKSNRKEVKIKEPSKVHKAKKAQEAKDRKSDRDKAKSVRESQKRTIDIQSPEVKTRMKNNNKEVASRDKIHKKKNRSATKSGARKYK